MCVTLTDPAAGNPAWHLPGIPDTGLHGARIDTGAVLGQMLRRASSPSFDSWWRRAESVGFCAHPIQLVGTDRFGRQHAVWTRCNNRRASVCPSCSDLYARDTWQLVHAGAAGGHHNIPATIATHPQVFTTLTAPSFGPVHHATGTTCRDHEQLGGYRRCVHGKPLWCSRIHDRHDTPVGQPLCPQCYDYRSHVSFTWHLPELWRRFTIALRRTVRRELKAAGVSPDSVRVSFVKVVEMQARAVPHIHALIRLDPTDADTTDHSEHTDHGPAATYGDREARNAAQPPWQSPLSAVELAALIHDTARQITIIIADPTAAPADVNGVDVGSMVVRFGTQIDTQPVTAVPYVPSADPVEPGRGGGLSARRVARYLAKYVTKSLHDFGIAARRLSAESIATLDVTDHIRAVLTTVTKLAAHASAHPEAGAPWVGIGRWLHTLGYRGHITTKSRTYSTTMTALRTRRAAWTRIHHDSRAEHVAAQDDQHDEQATVEWEFDRAGHSTLGDRVLAVSASLRHTAGRLTGLEQRKLSVITGGWAVPDG